MNYTLLLGIAWPEAASFDIPYGLASGGSLLLTIWFMSALRRTADQHYKLLKEEEERKKQERDLASDETPLLLAMATFLASCPALVSADDGQKSPPAITLNAFAETYIGWNSNRPQNGITAFRGFDARHNTFALSNAVIDTHWTAGAVSGRVALQTGDTPDIYYGSEATSDVRHVLEATVAWKASVGKGLTIDGGIFLSPIGPEVIPVKDDWTWSRSTLFYGLPFYHAGFRATYAVSERWTLTGAVFNGWNSVTDTNGKKSISVQGLYTKPDKIVASLLYFGGVERPRGAPEGQPWRHLFDAHITATVFPRFSFQAHGNAGFENSAFGRASWRAGAFAARVKANEWLFVAGRADILDETIPSSRAGSASSLFFPTTRVQSLTGTFEARPVDHVSIRLEFRRDHAADPIYFKGTNPSASAKSQTTVTLGMSAWF